jgi:Ca-activated chloride channel family protein
MNTQRLSKMFLLLCLLVTACAPAAQKTIQTATNTAVQPFVLDDQARGEEETGQNSALQPAAPQPYATQMPVQPLAEMPKELAAAPSTGSYQPGLVPQPAAGVPPVDNFYQNYGINPFMDAQEDHLSTFGLDVDTASYTVMRRHINDGYLPPADSVRVEEFVNYFNMGYPTPANVAFGIYADGAASPYASDGTTILRFGIQGYRVSESERKPANLVFVIDVSGSMAQEYRLEMVKRSLQMLVDRLRPDDSVGIVVYGSDARVVLEPVSGENRGLILEAIYSLQPEGSTNAEAGLILGYDMAMHAYRSGANNRVILCSDGVANTGATDPNVILSRIQGYVSEGINLTTVGFGMGNFNDVLMEQMADNGNGFYAYVDSDEEARKLFIDQITATLETIAQDAKVQVDFNSEIVARYRLIGYENRAIADQDFRNDQVDAGEIGAGHSATALYAVQLYPGAQGRIATVQLRWKDPNNYKVQEINGNFNTWDLAASFEQTDPHYQLAVTAAQFAEVLRSSPYANSTSLYRLQDQANKIARLLSSDQDVIEFAWLVDRAAQLNPTYFE